MSLLMQLKLKGESHEKNRNNHICYHLVAQKIAEALELYDKIEEEDRLYDCLMEEWKKVTA